MEVYIHSRTLTSSLDTCLGGLYRKAVLDHLGSVPVLETFPDLAAAASALVAATAAASEVRRREILRRCFLGVKRRFKESGSKLTHGECAQIKRRGYQRGQTNARARLLRCCVLALTYGELIRTGTCTIAHAYCVNIVCRLDAVPGLQL